MIVGREDRGRRSVIDVLPPQQTFSLKPPDPPWEASCKRQRHKVALFLPTAPTTLLLRLTDDGGEWSLTAEVALANG